LLPPGDVKYMYSPAPDSYATYGRSEYGMGQVWLHGPSSGTDKGTDPDSDRGFNLPSDTFLFSGYDGQSIALIPSLNLVVVSLGITPSRVRFKLQP